MVETRFDGPGASTWTAVWEVYGGAGEDLFGEVGGGGKVGWRGGWGGYVLSFARVVQSLLVLSES